MKLTNENIKTAIDFTENGLEDLQRRYPILIDANVIRTILAALDACRWRDAETELPELKKPILVVDREHKVWLAERYKTDHDKFRYSLSDTRKIYGLGNVHPDEIEAWLPLPEWEG